MRIHKRLLDILEPSPKTVESLHRIELPPATSRSSSGSPDPVAWQPRHLA
jgi:hypothetical protein